MSVSIDNLNKKIDEQESYLKEDSYKEITEKLKAVDETLDKTLENIITNQLGILGDMPEDKLAFIRSYILQKKQYGKKFNPKQVRENVNDAITESKSKKEQLAKETSEFLAEQGKLFEDTEKQIEELSQQLVKDAKNEIEEAKEKRVAEIEIEINDIAKKIDQKQSDILDAKEKGEDVTDLTQELNDLLGEQKDKNDEKENITDEKYPLGIIIRDINKNKEEKLEKINEFKDRHKKIGESYVSAAKFFEKEFERQGIDLKKVANPDASKKEEPQKTYGEQTTKTTGRSGGGSTVAGANAQQKDDDSYKNDDKDFIFTYLNAGSSKARLNMISDLGYSTLMDKIEKMKRDNKLGFFEKNELRKLLVLDANYLKNEQEKNISNDEMIKQKEDLSKISEALGIKIERSDLKGYVDFKGRKHNQNVKKIMNTFYDKRNNAELDPEIIQNFEDYIGSRVKYACIADEARKIDRLTPIGMAGNFFRRMGSLFSTKQTEILDLKNLINGEEQKLLAEGSMESHKKTELQETLGTYVRRPSEGPSKREPNDIQPKKEKKGISL